MLADDPHAGDADVATPFRPANGDSQFGETFGVDSVVDEVTLETVARGAVQAAAHAALTTAHDSSGAEIDLEAISGKLNASLPSPGQGA